MQHFDKNVFLKAERIILRRNARNEIAKKNIQYIQIKS